MTQPHLERLQKEEIPRQKSESNQKIHKAALVSLQTDNMLLGHKYAEKGV